MQKNIYIWTQMIMLPDHLRPSDGLLQLHESLLVLVPLHQHSGHLHSGEALPLCCRHITLQAGDRSLLKEVKYLDSLRCSDLYTNATSRNNKHQGLTSSSLSILTFCLASSSSARTLRQITTVKMQTLDWWAIHLYIVF